MGVHQWQYNPSDRWLADKAGGRLMAEATIKVHAFRIQHAPGSVPLEQAIEDVSQQPDLAARLRNVGDRSIRAEDIEWDEDYGVWLMDLVWFRETHGPGKGSFDRPVRGHQYEDDEYPTEDTGALFDPQTSHLIIQYNHQGVRIASLLEYFARYNAEAASAYNPEVLLDSGTAQKFEGRAATKKFELAIAPQELTLEEWRHDVGISEAIRAGQETNARRVKIVCSMGRQQGALSEAADAVLDKLWGRVQTGDRDGIDTLRVGVLEHVDATLETLDLIGQRLTLERTWGLDAHRRIPRTDRWRTLKIAFRQWRERFA